MEKPQQPTVAEPSTRKRLQPPRDTTVRDIGAIIALGVIRWHRRRAIRTHGIDAVGPETGHTKENGDPLVGTET